MSARVPGWPASGSDLFDLCRAITDFEEALPGWWWSIGACSVSRDASCGPDRAGPDARLLMLRQFDDGFHKDDREGTCADALRAVMRMAIEAKAALPTPNREKDHADG